MNGLTPKAPITVAHGHGHGHKPFVIGVIDMHKLQKMFFDAAWAIVQAVHSTTSEASAGVPFMTTMAIESDNTRLLHGAHIIARDFTDMFVDILHERGGEAANVYARGIHARQLAAERQVQSMVKEVDQHNRSTEHAAGEIAYGLADTIFVCEIALAVGTCVLSLGAAPAFLAGGASAMTQSFAAMGISTAYSFTANAIKENRAEGVDGFATSFKTSASTFVSGTAMDKMSEHKHARSAYEMETAIRARRAVDKANLKLAKSIGAKVKQPIYAQRAVAQQNWASAALKSAHLEQVSKALHHGSQLMSFVQLGSDIRDAFAEQRKRLDELAH